MKRKSGATWKPQLPTDLTRTPGNVVIRQFFRLVFSPLRSGQVIYMSVSGGKGKIYEAIFLLISRIKGLRIYLHHHSYAYVSRWDWLMRIVTLIAGKHAKHIAQSANMTTRLMTLYGIRNTWAISNAVLLPDPNEIQYNPKGRGVHTLGFLSNISAEKGIFDFLDTADLCRERKLALSVKVAGPFQDPETERLVRQRIDANELVEYVGPKYGEEKQRFFDEIDVFLFPTRYANETEGIVNHEAMSAGVPVIAVGRGCIPDFIGDDAGLVVDPAADFAPAAFARICAWMADKEAFINACSGARARFLGTYSSNIGRWSNLLSELAS